MTLAQQLAEIKPLDSQAMAQAQAQWNNIAKPLHSLGLLEDALVKIAGITGSPHITLEKKGVLVLCADNGVVAQGVSQTGQEVTAIVGANMAKGATCVCHMAKVAGATVIPVDMGCISPVPRIQNCAVRPGTADFTQEPAMTLAEAETAIQRGISLVKQQKDQGIHLLATGEMGIGNTTTSTAVLSVLLEQSPAQLTGTGAGLSPQGLQRKKQAIAQAIALHQPNPRDIVSLLSKLGGLDIAGLCGVFLGGAMYRVPILVDGLISATSALCASKLAPLSVDFMVASHQSKEKACGFALEALGLRPLLQAELAVGEGTGAVAVMPLLDMAVAVYRDMDSFQEIGVEAYQPQENPC